MCCSRCCMPLAQRSYRDNTLCIPNFKFTYIISVLFRALSCIFCIPCYFWQAQWLAIICQIQSLYYPLYFYIYLFSVYKKVIGPFSGLSTSVSKLGCATTCIEMIWCFASWLYLHSINLQFFKSHRTVHVILEKGIPYFQNRSCFNVKHTSLDTSLLLVIPCINLQHLLLLTEPKEVGLL